MTTQYYKPFSKQREMLHSVWNTLTGVDWDQFVLDAEKDVQRFISTEPKRFTVFLKNGKHRETNDENTALNWAVKYDGETYIDTRYEAKIRFYHYIKRKLLWEE